MRKFFNGFISDENRTGWHYLVGFLVFLAMVPLFFSWGMPVIASFAVAGAFFGVPFGYFKFRKDRKSHTISEGN